MPRQRANRAGAVLVAEHPDRDAIGLKVDRGRLFVAGGATGDGYVYDARTGATSASDDFASAATFVNDVAATKRAAWFTDSQRAPAPRARSTWAAEAWRTATILLEGRTLYVVQNQLNRVAKITLRPGLRSGRIVKTITDPQLAVPTTIDAHGSRLYAVNARFGTPPTPSTEYWVTRLPR